MIRPLVCILAFSACCYAQSERTKQPTTKAPCVILSSTEPAQGIATWSEEGRRQRHALTYLAGDYPPGIPFRSSIKDSEVDKIKAKGGRVLILDPHYTREDLEKAKQTCETPPNEAMTK
jgi:hypothetical protein